MDLEFGLGADIDDKADHPLVVLQNTAFERQVCYRKVSTKLLADYMPPPLVDDVVWLSAIEMSFNALNAVGWEILGERPLGLEDGLAINRRLVEVCDVVNRRYQQDVGWQGIPALNHHEVAHLKPAPGRLLKAEIRITVFKRLLVVYQRVLPSQG